MGVEISIATAEPQWRWVQQSATPLVISLAEFGKCIVYLALKFWLVFKLLFFHVSHQLRRQRQCFGNPGRREHFCHQEVTCRNQHLGFLALEQEGRALRYCTKSVSKVTSLSFELFSDVAHKRNSPRCLKKLLYYRRAQRHKSRACRRPNSCGYWKPFPAPQITREALSGLITPSNSLHPKIRIIPSRGEHAVRANLGTVSTAPSRPFPGESYNWSSVAAGTSPRSWLHIPTPL